MGLDQGAFAEAVGANVHTLRDWEHGRHSPKYPALRRIADYTRRSIEWFLEGAASQPAPDNDLSDILQRTERQLEEIRKRLAERDATELREIPITRWVSIPIIGIAPGGGVGGGGGDD